MSVLRVVKNASVGSLRRLHLFASSFHAQCEFYMCCMSDSTIDMLLLCCVILVHVLDKLREKSGGSVVLWSHLFPWFPSYERRTGSFL